MDGNVRLDLDFVRAQFPAFRHPSTGPWAFLENAGGSYVPAAVMDRLNRFLVATKVQPYGDFPAAVEAGETMDAGRARIAALINAHPEEVVIGASTTMNVYVLAQALRPTLRPGDEIIVTNQDHEANIGAWRRLAEAGAVIREWCIDPVTGLLDRADLEGLLSQRTRLCCVTHCSNIVAAINDIPAIAAAVHAAGGLVMVDGVSYAPHGFPDVRALDADFYAFSLYKTYGPHLGLLYVRQDHLALLANQNHGFLPAGTALALNPGGENHEETAALQGIADYLDALHAHHLTAPEPDPRRRGAAVFALFAAQEEALATRLVDYLRDRPEVRLIGPRSGARSVRAPTIAFTVAGRRSHDIVRALLPHQVAIRSGNFYAWRCVEALGLGREDGVVRASMVHYNTLAEVDRLIAGLERTLERR